MEYEQLARSSASRAFIAFWSSRDWTTNWMLLTVAAIAQYFVVGQIFVLGYGVEVLRRRSGLSDAGLPNIDTSRLTEYFLKGLWPFLAYMVTSVVLNLICLVPSFLIIGIAMSMIQSGSAPAFVTLIYLFIVFVTFGVSLAVILICTPIVIRAMICQDFVKAFDAPWIVSFLKLMWKDVLFTGFVFGVIATPMMFLGMLMCIVGIFPVVGLLSGVGLHLLSQWYEVFLSRGGMPVSQPEDDDIVEATVV